MKLLLESIVNYLLINNLQRYGVIEKSVFNLINTIVSIINFLKFLKIFLNKAKHMIIICFCETMKLLRNHKNAIKSK